MLASPLEPLLASSLDTLLDTLLDIALEQPLEQTLDTLLDTLLGFAPTPLRAPLDITRDHQGKT